MLQSSINPMGGTTQELRNRGRSGIIYFILIGRWTLLVHIHTCLIAFLSTCLCYRFIYVFGCKRTMLIWAEVFPSHQKMLRMPSHLHFFLPRNRRYRAPSTLFHVSSLYFFPQAQEFFFHAYAPFNSDIFSHDFLLSLGTWNPPSALAHFGSLS
jgi:hypothetical protein